MLPQNSCQRTVQIEVVPLKGRTQRGRKNHFFMVARYRHGSMSGEKTPEKAQRKHINTSESNQIQLIRLTGLKFENAAIK